MGIVLVEGESDRAALLALAARRGIAVQVVAMGGATNIARFLRQYAGVPVTGLCDAAEEGFFRRAWAGRDDGFSVCHADLEDELIRALGVPAVEAVVEAAGELASLRRFQRMPAHLGEPAADQLHRFLGTRSGRKIRYGQLLVDALDLDRVPEPLDTVLAAS